MNESFGITALKVIGGVFVVLFGVAVVAVQVMDAVTNGMTWQKGVQWILTGAVIYGVYRFYMHGRDTRSAYHERWEGLFEREPDAKPGENGP
jgi:membrane protein implicated in regulation of membrane protease activity